MSKELCKDYKLGLVDCCDNCGHYMMCECPVINSKEEDAHEDFIECRKNYEEGDSQ